jgi:hypothetical protein
MIMCGLEHVMKEFGEAFRSILTEPKMNKEMGIYTKKFHHVGPTVRTQNRAAKYLKELAFFKPHGTTSTKLRTLACLVKIPVDQQTRTVFSNQGDGGYL